MSFKNHPERWTRVISSGAAAILLTASAHGADAVFATDTNAGANIEKPMPGAAAVVDGHVISMDDVIVGCLQRERSFIVDQMIQGYVLDRECEKRGITVTDQEIDDRIKTLRASLAPATLEDTLKRHHMTMPELRHVFKQSLEKPKLIENQIKPVKMRHCRQILIRCLFNGVSRRATVVTSRPESQALARIKDIQEQLKQGKSFEALAAQYTESEPFDGKGEMGVLYENMMDTEADVLTAAMALKKGEVSQPIKTSDGYCLIEAVSTDADHPAAEDEMYKKAGDKSRDLQKMFLAPKAVTDLIDKSHITFAKDEDIVAGKPLPTAAAVVDGHVIPMSEVVDKCMAEDGPKMVDILVQNYLVDRECQRRGITVSEAEIDERVDKLKKQIAPQSMDEALKRHHTTMARLRTDFRQELERMKLVMDDVKPTKMVHARALFVRMEENPTASAGTNGPAAKVLDELKSGKSFEDLSKEYPVPGNRNAGGDLGILYEDMRGMDTAMLKEALTMKKGEVSSAPVQTRGGCFLLQIVSTSDDHANDEDGAYAEAAKSYREGKAQSLAPQAVVGLIKKSKVVYYLHS